MMRFPARRRAMFWAMLGVHAILVQAISYAIRPALSYAVLELGYGPVWLATMTAAFALPPLLLALTTGRLVDRVGERPGMVLGGLALTGSSLLAYFGAGQLVALIAATGLLGVGIIFSMVGEQSAVAGQAGQRGMDSAFGIYTFITSLGQGVGPLLLLIPPTAGTLSPPLAPIAAVCALAGLGIVATSLGFGSYRRTVPEPEAPARRWPARRLIALPGMWRALLVSGLILASIDVTLAYLPALVHGRGIAPVWLTAMLGARAVAQMLSRINLGRLTRVFGRRRLTITACAASALALCGLTLPVPVAVLVGLAATYGFVAGVCQPMTMGWVAQLAPRGTRGTVLSLRLAGNRVAQTVIPALSGAAAAAGGVSGVLVLTGATLGVAAWSAAAIPHSDS